MRSPHRSSLLCRLTTGELRSIVAEVPDPQEHLESGIFGKGATSVARRKRASKNTALAAEVRRCRAGAFRNLLALAKHCAEVVVHVLLIDEAVVNRGDTPLTVD